MNKKYFPLVIAGLGLLVYANTFASPFHFDDEFMLRFVADFDAVLARVFTPRGLGYLGFALNYALHGRDVFGYHLVNLAIHIATSVMVYFFSLQIFETPLLKKKPLTQKKHLLSFFIALVFVGHPLQTQAVTYIVQRFAAQAALFFITGSWLYLRARLEKKNSLYFWAVGAFVLGLLTKTNVATWPLVLVLLELLFFPPKKQADFFQKRILPILAVAAVSIFTAIKFFGQVIFDPRVSPLGETITSSTYFFTQMKVIPLYIRLLFFPFQQNLDYYFPVSQHFGEPTVLLGFFLLLGILWLGFLWRKTQPLLAFGIGWFFLTLAVESSFIPIRDVIFEHRVYLPLLGFAFWLVAGLYWLIERFVTNKTQALKKFTVLASFIVVFYAGLAHLRNRVWQTSLSLMTDVTQKSPQKARGYNWLGLAYQEEGDLATAKEKYQTAITLNPRYQDAHNNLGNIYSYEGELEPAVFHFEQALALGGRRVTDITLNLGLAYFNVQQYEQALAHFQAVLEQEPRNTLAIEYVQLVESRMKEEQ